MAGFEVSPEAETRRHGAFDKITTPTPLQQRAFGLLAVSPLFYHLTAPHPTRSSQQVSHYSSQRRELPASPKFPVGQSRNP